MDIAERLGGIGEAALGGVLVTSSYWGPLLDGVISGAHVVAALTGAAVGLHGIYRIMKGRRR